MRKQKARAFGKNVYLLGTDGNGKKHWLCEATWDCDWYWGLGYVESFTNNHHPERARDIDGHTHFNWLTDGKKNLYNSFNDFIDTTPLSDSEVWTLCELMKSLYTLRDYSDLLHIGGAHYTSNPESDTIKNDTEYKRINEVVIPRLLERVYKLLSPEDTEE